MEQDLDVRRIFEEVAATACETLFGRYGVPVRRVSENEEPVSPEFHLCSIMATPAPRFEGRWCWR